MFSLLFFLQVRKFIDISLEQINSLPNKKNIPLSKSEACARGKLNVAQMDEFVFGRVENIVAKGENASTQHF